MNVLPPSPLPILLSIALGLSLYSLLLWLHGSQLALYLAIFPGVALLLAIGLWLKVAVDDKQGLSKAQLLAQEMAYRWAMFWFIVSELWLFLTFFAVLFYARWISVPTLAGTYTNTQWTHYLLWPNFRAQWPLLQTPDPEQFVGPTGVIAAWGVPSVNTAVLLASGVTITLAHYQLLCGRRNLALFWQLLTAFLGGVFLYLQWHEYAHAMTHLGLGLDAGIYASVFFMLTGFHGVHVLLGTLMLLGVALRMWYGHFSVKSHFAFAAVSWYWHFVDVVWLCVFVFVYWI